MPTVPNIVGMTVTDAKDARNAVGLTAGSFTNSVGSAPFHTVISQHPAAGATVAAGSAVDVTAFHYSSVKDATNYSQGDGMIWGS